MQEQPTSRQSESCPSERKPSEPSSANQAQTIKDLEVALLAAENAQFLHKKRQADADVEKYRARMNKAADAQVEDFVNRASPKASEGTLGQPLTVPQEKSPGLLGRLLRDSSSDSALGSTSNSMDLEDDMAVLTNSPVTVTHNHPVVERRELPAWAKVMIAGIFALAVIICLLIVSMKGCEAPAPPPQTDEQGNLHIEVIPGPNHPNH